MPLNFQPYEQTLKYLFISQQLSAQLLRIFILLVISLAIVHHSPTLLQALALESMNSGCHQVSDSNEHPFGHHNHEMHQHHHPHH